MQFDDRAGKQAEAQGTLPLYLHVHFSGHLKLREVGDCESAKPCLRRFMYLTREGERNRQKELASTASLPKGSE